MASTVQTTPDVATYGCPVLLSSQEVHAIVSDDCYKKKRGRGEGDRSGRRERKAEDISTVASQAEGL